MAGTVKPPPCVLTIAGSDSGAGAGIQADARTIQALGGHAVTAITAVTAQSGRGVRAWQAVAPRLIAAQVTAVLEGFPVAAIKTGLLPGPAAIRAIAAVLRRHPRLPLVIDPVMGSTSGTRFLSPAAWRELRRSLFPLAALLTPNRPEAEALAGRRLRTGADVAAAARRLAAEAGCAVLIKGGHAPGRLCRDCLATPAGRVRWYQGPRVATRNTHGTGCVLSAAIAAELARGRRLEVAVGRARAFLLGALRRNRRLRWGRGAGPVLGR
jgi:hydroxymethylpyrimidine/phosphomethylpyrimidine kinase